MIKLESIEKNFPVSFFPNWMKTKIIIPIFPLSGIIFFPNTNLPLNIFEPRYIEMVDYALDSNSNIGMIQERENGALYSFGCIGKITSCKKKSDGGYLINLMGQDFFELKNEIELKKIFRLAEVWISLTNSKKANLNLNKLRILELLREYEQFMTNKDLEINLNYFKGVEKNNIIKFIAMTAPFSTADKQMLLETPSLNELFEKLITLLQYYNLVESRSIN